MACRDVSGLHKGRSVTVDREHLSCSHCWALQKHLKSTKCCSHLRVRQKKDGLLGRMVGRLKLCVSQGQNKERPVGYTQGYQVLYWTWTSCRATLNVSKMAEDKSGLGQRIWKTKYISNKGQNSWQWFQCIKAYSRQIHSPTSVRQQSQIWAVHILHLWVCTLDLPLILKQLLQLIIPFPLFVHSSMGLNRGSRAGWVGGRISGCSNLCPPASPVCRWTAPGARRELGKAAGLTVCAALHGKWERSCESV